MCLGRWLSPAEVQRLLPLTLGLFMANYLIDGDVGHGQVAHQFRDALHRQFTLVAVGQGDELAAVLGAKKVGENGFGGAVGFRYFKGDPVEIAGVVFGSALNLGVARTHEIFLWLAAFGQLRGAIIGATAEQFNLDIWPEFGRVAYTTPLRFRPR